jgi:predicted metal-dependent HD superfamily phosphohydrolase
MMTQPETEIRNAWHHAVGHHHDGYLDALLVRYREPHRHYHTATHIMWVVRHLRELAADPSVELVAAALYHDAIYDPQRSDNEALSAALAVRDLAEIGWTAASYESVATMIRATATHLDDGGEAETALLLDADLAILGADSAAYQAYVNGIRAEYAHVDDASWREGRSAVLRHFLGRPRLFTTDSMCQAREHRARANIEAELATLR